MYAAIIGFVLGLLTGIKQQYQKHPASDSQSADERTKGPPNPIVAEVRFPESVERERRTYEKKQHSNQKQLVIATWFTFGAVSIYAGITLGLWYETHQAGKIASQQLEMSERPWIDIDLVSVGPITYDDPNRFKIQFAIKITNVGHSPAVNVNIAPKVVDPWGMKFNGDIMDQQKAICAGYAKIKTGEAWGRTMFPGRDYTETFAHDLSRDEITALTAPNMEKFWPKDRIKPYILGCVDYMVAFSGVHHQTYFVYDLWGTSESGTIEYLKMGVNTPAARIKFFTNSPFVIPSN